MFKYILIQYECMRIFYWHSRFGNRCFFLSFFASHHFVLLHHKEHYRKWQRISKNNTTIIINDNRNNKWFKFNLLFFISCIMCYWSHSDSFVCNAITHGSLFIIMFIRCDWLLHFSLFDAIGSLYAIHFISFLFIWLHAIDCCFFLYLEYACVRVIMTLCWTGQRLFFVFKNRTLNVLSASLKIEIHFIKNTVVAILLDY